MSRTAKRQIIFADWELMQQGLSLEPLLENISEFLADHEEMIEIVRCDLERGLKNARTGRSGLTPQQVRLRYRERWETQSGSVLER